MSFVRDLVERVAWTFAQAFLGAITLPALVDIVSGGEAAMPTLHAALLAGAAAVLSMLKGVAASRLGTPGTASTADRPQVDELGNLETAP